MGSNINETRHPRRILRSIGAVLAGFLTIVILSTATDLVMHATGVFPTLGQPMADSLFLIATSYRIVFGIAGCYIAALLSPDRPMKHALALGVIGVVVSIAGAIVMWEAGPAWYSLAVIAMSIPCAWVGGKFREMQMREQVLTHLPG